ncbi:MAG: sulfatase family protein [Luteolibacter sp.]
MTNTLSLILAACCFSTITARAADDTAPSKPNILFCIADDASMRSFGAYGGKTVPTPVFDRLASEGALFKNAYVNNPKCSPARACLLTGRFTWQLKEAADHYAHFPSEFKVYPELLKQTGYHVGCTGKGWGPGTYDSADNPAGHEYNAIKLKQPFKGIHNIDYAANFDAFLEEKNSTQPFCFWLGVYEPHRPYEKGSGLKSGLKLEDAELPPFYPDNEIVRSDLLDYAVEIKWFDTQIGRAITALENRGFLENTLIIITSDHGMPFPRIKGQLYDEGCHVPMVAVWKGVIQPGRVIDDFVNFPDVAPTFMEVAGLAAHPQMTGKSFLDVLRSEKSGQIDPSRSYVLLGKERHDTGRASEGGTNLAYPVRAIRTKDFLYVHNIKPELWPTGNPEFGLRNCDASPTKEYLTSLAPSDKDFKFYEISFGKRPEEELYQIQKDPDCINNLASNPEYDSLKQQLRKQMEADLTDQRDPRTLGQGDVFDHYPYVGPAFDYETGQPTKPKDGQKGD